MAEFVRLEVDGGIGVIRLDRPPMNAISRQVQEELVVVAAEAATRADVRAVVVYGGEKVLAAGADVKEMAKMSYADMAARVARGVGRLRRDGHHPEAHRGRDHRLRARRRHGAGAGLRPAHRGRQRQARPARDPARRHPGRRRHPAARPADRPVAREGPHPHRADGGGRRGARDRPRRRGRARRRGVRAGDGVRRAVREGPVGGLRGREARRSTAGWTPTCAPASTWRPTCSRRSSPPTTSASA